MIKFKELYESLRGDISKVASKYPEGSSVNVKGKAAKVMSHGSDFLVVAMGNKTMNVKLKDVDESVEESTAAYAASLEKIANDKKLKNISKKDRDMLVKLADLMKNANEK